MKATTHYRKGSVIRGPKGDEVFKSVNKAKAASRIIQHKNGGLGCGSLAVVDKLPELEAA